MELLVSAKLAHSLVQRYWRTPSSMEFHGIARVSEIGALQVPWNSMELLVSAKLAHSKFNAIPWNSMELLESSKLAHEKNSMEFHGTALVIEIGALLVSHGIPWNCSCHRNWRTPSSMELHRIPWNCSCQRNWRILSSMEFHGTALVIEIGALLVPWNSMEFYGTSRVSEIGAF